MYSLALKTFKVGDNTVMSIQVSRDEIVDAGLRLLALLYNEKPGESLNHLRYT